MYAGSYIFLYYLLIKPSTLYKPKKKGTYLAMHRYITSTYKYLYHITLMNPSIYDWGDVISSPSFSYMTI